MLKFVTLFLSLLGLSSCVTVDELKLEVSLRNFTTMNWGCIDHSTSCTDCIYADFEAFIGKCAFVASAEVVLVVNQTIGVNDSLSVFNGTVQNVCLDADLLLWSVDKVFYPAVTVKSDVVHVGEDRTYSMSVDVGTNLNEGQGFLCMDLLTRDIIFYASSGAIVAALLCLLICIIVCCVCCCCCCCKKKDGHGSDSDEAVDLEMDDRTAKDVEDGSKVKIVVVGDGAVGKTCMLIVYGKADHAFPKDYVPTIFDNYHVSVNVEINEEMKELDLSLWDTAGQEDYDDIRSLSYSNVDVFLVCFSVVDETSWSNVKHKWVKEIKEASPDAAVILVGTKMDLRESSGDCVSEKDIKKYKKKIKAKAYCECSALKFEGVKEIFDECVNCYVYG